MKVSHIMYKVDNLEQGVEAFRKKGFVVEYGKEKNPNNALIYFSEGPYIELLAGSEMPLVLKGLLRLFGQGKLVDRLNGYDKHPGGPCGLALENYRTELDAECAVLKKYGYKVMQTNIKRNDTKGRNLQFRVGFPSDIGLPFFMTYFSVDPKPKNFVHPNGIASISHVTFETKKAFFPIIQELCDDEMLTLREGNDVVSVKFAYATGHEQASATLEGL